jgi:hypothetical protein
MSRWSASARFALAICGVLSALFFSWWITAVCIAVLAICWRSWEAVAIGLLMDLLWLPPHGFPFFFAGSILLVWLLEPLRREFFAG